jgi:hypothetical protein
MQMLGVIRFILDLDAGTPDRPGKFVEYAGNTDFDVGGIEVDINAVSKLAADVALDVERTHAVSACSPVSSARSGRWSESGR